MPPSQLQKKDPIHRYAYIDALRGIAIILVIFGHTYPRVAFLPEWIQSFGFQGGRGVQLFFMVSALTLFLSLDTRTAYDQRVFVNFFIRRFFRIAPLFYTGIAIYMALDGFKPRYWAPDGIGWGHVIATATFMHGWHPTALTSVVPGGWSIAVEMTFYACVPLLYRKIKNGYVALAAVIGTLMLSLLLKNYTYWFLKANTSLKLYLVDTFTRLWFPSQLPVFMLGIALYFMIRRSDREEKSGKTKSLRAWLFLVIFLYLFGALPFGGYDFIPDYFIYGVAFVCLSYSLSLHPHALFVNRIICFIGKISFSCYIFHFLAIRIVRQFLGAGHASFYFGLPSPVQLLLFFLATVGLTVMFSYLSFRYIEETGIRMGRRIISRMENRAV